MTKIHFFDFSTPLRENDFSISIDTEFEGPLAFLRYFARTETLEWNFDFDVATPEEIFFWTEAHIIVLAERAFFQRKMVFLEGHIVELNDFCHSLALFSRVFGSLPDMTNEDFYSVSFSSPVTDMEKHYQFVERLLSAPV